MENLQLRRAIMQKQQKENEKQKFKKARSERKDRGGERKHMLFGIHNNILCSDGANIYII